VAEDCLRRAVHAFSHQGSVTSRNVALEMEFLIMTTTTYTSMDRDESASHGSLYAGIHAFLRQFVLVAVDLTEATAARDMRGYLPARIEAFRREMRMTRGAQ
jgi:hypothetical protein